MVRGSVNGDGIDDFAVGAFGAFDPGSPNNDWGEVYVIYGSTALPAGGMFDPGAASASEATRLRGATPGDWAGFSVSSAGDFNADGFGDIIVSGTRAEGAVPDSGRAYVVFGAAGSLDADGLFELGVNPTFDLLGEVGAPSGGARMAVSGLGDVNGDGTSDIGVGVRNLGNGAAYAVYGSASRSGGSSLNLGSLASTDGMKFTGTAAGDLFGFSISGVGDHNGDGIGDFAVGAPGADFPARSNAGAAYLIYGRTPRLVSLTMSTLNGTNGVRIAGAKANDEFGSSVGPGGDHNADGRADLIAGAPKAEEPGGNTRGKTYVFHGPAPFGTAGLFDLASSSASVEVRGTANLDQSGLSASSAGDFDNDGDSDLVIGAPFSDAMAADGGTAYLVYSDATPPASATTVTFSRPGANPRAAVGASGRAEQAHPYSHFSVNYNSGSLGMDTVTRHESGAPIALPLGSAFVAWEFSTTRTLWSHADITLHYTDNWQQTPFEDRLAIYQAASLAGPWTRLDTVVDRDRNTLTARATSTGFFTFSQSNVIPLDATGSTEFGVAIDGDGDSAQHGFSVSSLGDVNGDGYEDLFIGGPFLDFFFTDAGMCAVLFGSQFGYAGPLNVASLPFGAYFFRSGGASANDQLGFTAKGVGDVNGDGNNDFAVTEILGDKPGSTNCGDIYLVFGGPALTSLDLDTLDGTNGVLIRGEVGGDYAGASIAPVGDYNGDGIDDFLIGAPQNDAGGANAGAVYMLHGRPAWSPTLDLAFADAKITGAAAGDTFGRSVAGLGDVNYDGLSGDFAVGADGADPMGRSGAGSVYVIYEGTSLAGFTLASIDGTNGLRLDGAAANDATGWSVAGVIDVGLDGANDLAIGAYRSSPGGVFRAGTVYRATLPLAHPVDLSVPDPDIAVFTGTVEFDHLGYSVASGGQFFGAGILLAGAWGDDGPGGSFDGTTAVIAGDVPGGTLATLVDDPDALLLRGSGNGASGWSVCNVGDFDGFSLPNYAIGSPQADVFGTDNGRVHVYGFGDGYWAFQGLYALASAGELNGLPGFVGSAPIQPLGFVGDGTSIPAGRAFVGIDGTAPGDTIETLGISGIGPLPPLVNNLDTAWYFYHSVAAPGTMRVALHYTDFDAFGLDESLFDLYVSDGVTMTAYPLLINPSTNTVYAEFPAPPPLTVFTLFIAEDLTP